MIIVILLIIYIIYILSRIIVHLLVKRYGYFSHDGFSFTGFKYDSKKNTFVPVKNPWQRKFGYGYIYDLLAPFVNIIIDTESIHFEYDGYNYLISFWKGQYGIATGAEIGIYYTDKKINKYTIYNALEKEIDMSFVLYKNDKIVLETSDKHWWLAAFKLGEFTNPKDLRMDIMITFPNVEFLNSFLSGFKKLKYDNTQYKVIGSTFIFTFIHPHTKKVWTRNVIRDFFVLKTNRINSKLYSSYFDNYIDKNGIKTSLGDYLFESSVILNNLLGDEDDKSR